MNATSVAVHSLGDPSARELGLVLRMALIRASLLATLMATAMAVLGLPVGFDPPNRTPWVGLQIGLPVGFLGAFPSAFLEYRAIRLQSRGMATVLSAWATFAIGTALGTAFGIWVHAAFVGSLPADVPWLLAPVRYVLWHPIWLFGIVLSALAFGFATVSRVQRRLSVALGCVLPVLGTVAAATALVLERQILAVALLFFFLIGIGRAVDEIAEIVYQALFPSRRVWPVGHPALDR